MACYLIKRIPALSFTTQQIQKINLFFVVWWRTQRGNISMLICLLKAIRFPPEWTPPKSFYRQDGKKNMGRYPCDFFLKCGGDRFLREYTGKKMLCFMDV